MQVSHPRLIALIVCALVGQISVVDAQSVQQLPGLVVTIPPPQPQAPIQALPPQPQVQAPPPIAPAPPKPKAAAKPKPVQPKVASVSGPGNGGFSTVYIATRVNDDPITNVAIEQRARFLSIQSNIGQEASAMFKKIITSPATNARLKEIYEQTLAEAQAKHMQKEEFFKLFEARKTAFAQSLQKQAVDSARASTWPAQKEAAKEELILESLKLQEAKRLNITVDDKDVTEIIKGIAERNKKTVAQFEGDLAHMGVEPATLRARFKATIAWQNVVRQRFSNDVVVNDSDVDQMMALDPSASQSLVELQLLKITVPYPAKQDQKALLQSYDQVQRLQSEFKGCAGAQAMMAGVPGAKVEDLGTKPATAIAEPTRSFLMAAKEGELVPFNPGAGVWEAYAVCARKAVKADDEKRGEVLNELRQQQFQARSERQLREMRQQAQVVNR